MKTVAVFGATGMVGAYAAVELSKQYTVIAVGRSKSDNGFFSDHGIKYYSADITIKEDFNILPREGIDAVIHAAGIMPARIKNNDPHLYVDSIIHGTLNVLDYMVESEINKIIYTYSRDSSLYKLGKVPIPSDMHKIFPLNSDHSIYTICKNTTADIIDHYHYKYKIDRFILNTINIYNYHPNPYFFSGGKKRWMANRLMIEKAKYGMDIEIWGDPTKTKELLYIYDYVRAINCALDSSSEGGYYNVGGVVPVTLEEQIRDILEVFSPPGKSSRIIYAPDKPSGVEFVEDATKTRRELGYIPQWDHLSFLRDMKEKMQTRHFEKLWGTFNDYEDKSLECFKSC